jgi:tetratricopeptide (TPR) repeat protein
LLILLVATKAVVIPSRSVLIEIKFMMRIPSSRRTQISQVICFVILTSYACGCAFGFSERSQPAPGGGFRNDSRGGGFDPSNRGYAALIPEGNRAYSQGEFARAVELMDYALKASRTPEQVALALVIRGGCRGRLFQTDLALKDLNAAIQSDPKLAGAYYERGYIFRWKNEVDAAIKDYDHAIQLKPKNTHFYEAKAATLLQLHRSNEALNAIQSELSVNPKAPGAYGYRALIEERMGRTQPALSDAETALTLDHNSLEGHVARARTYARLKEVPQAEEELRVLSHLRSASGESTKLNTIAWIRATCPEQQLRNGKEAIAMAKKACEQTHWQNPAYVDTLAAAYAEAGDFDSAIKYQEEALKGPNSRPPANEDLRQRLELYQKHQPYRDTKNG